MFLNETSNKRDLHINIVDGVSRAHETTEATVAFKGQRITSCCTLHHLCQLQGPTFTTVKGVDVLKSQVESVHGFRAEVRLHDLVEDRIGVERQGTIISMPVVSISGPRQSCKMSIPRSTRWRVRDDALFISSYRFMELVRFFFC